jgi:hypothetical protein
LLGTAGSSSKFPIVGTVQPTARPKPASQASSSQTSIGSSTVKSGVTNVKALTPVKPLPSLVKFNKASEKPVASAVKQAIQKTTATSTVRIEATQPVKITPPTKSALLVKSTPPVKSTSAVKTNAVAVDKSQGMTPPFSAPLKPQKANNMSTTSKQKIPQASTSSMPNFTPGPSMTNSKPQKLSNKRSSMDVSPSTSTGKSVKR